MSWTCRGGRALRSAKGFSACGDAVFAWMRPGSALFAVVDALGHGRDAAASADIVAQVLTRSCDRPLTELFLSCDRALAGHRAVVMSAIQLKEEKIRFAGIGNVEIWGPPDVSRPPTSAGVVGRGLHRVREWDLPVQDGHRWVLASDGIQRRAAAKALLDAQPLAADEAAERILQLAGREDDDVGVVVVDWTWK